MEEGTRDGLGTARAREAEAEPEGGTGSLQPRDPDRDRARGDAELLLEGEQRRRLLRWNPLRRGGSEDG